MEAHYWLGYCLSLLIFGEDDTVKRLKRDERQTREYEAVLAGTAPGDALREKAFSEYMQGTCDLQNVVAARATSNYMTAQEIAEWQPKALAAWQRMRDFVERYLTEPPKKKRGDYFHLLPAYRLRLASTNDAQPLIDWFLLLDTVYGSNHAAYDTRCPFLCLAQELLWANRPQQALAFYLRGMEAHGHVATTPCLNGKTAWGLELEIRKALGEGDSDQVKLIEKTLQAEEAERWSCQPLREAFSKWPGAEPPVAEAPEGLVATVARFPFDGSVLAASTGRSDSYFFIGAEGLSGGSGNGQRRDRYRVHKLIRKSPGSGITVEIPLERNGETARVTVILSVGDTVWFGTHQGLARYDARRQDSRWLEKADGVPLCSILSGCYANGKLWFGGDNGGNASVIFSLDPGEGRVRTYGLDIGPAYGPPLGIAVRKDIAFVITRPCVHQIDLRSGRSTALEILSPAGKLAVNKNDIRRTGYQPTTVPVFCRGQWWVGTTGGLALLEQGDPPAFRVLFSTGHNEYPSEYEVLARHCKARALPGRRLCSEPRARSIGVSTTPGKTR